MSTPTQIQPLAAPTAGPLAADLRLRVRGTVHVPGEPGYDAARSAWNVAAVQSPAAVVVPVDAADVAAVLSVARDAGLRVAPQGPGHGAVALGPLERTILLRTHALGGVSVDVPGRTVRVGAGVQMGEIVAATAPHGLAPVSGSTGGVSAVGFSLGGGIGWLSRELGLASTHVTAIELVTADGEQVRATATEHADLFWALRGGGGAFGVVTAMELALHEVPVVTGGAMLWPIERAPEVLRAWRDWTRGLPESTTTSARLLRFPPFEEVPEPVRGRAFVILDGAVTGDPLSARALLHPLRALGPEIDTWHPAGPEVLPELHMDPKDPTPAFHGHVLLADADDLVLDTLLELAGPGRETPLLFAELRHLGGALGRRAPGGGALDHIAAGFSLTGVGVPMGPLADALPEALAALEAAGAHQAAGAYANFTETEGPEALFPPAVLARLRAIKDAVDPQDRIHANHPVR
jgi:hypothetical protein